MKQILNTTTPWLITCKNSKKTPPISFNREHKTNSFKTKTRRTAEARYIELCAEKY